MAQISKNFIAQNPSWQMLEHFSLGLMTSSVIRWKKKRVKDIFNTALVPWQELVTLFYFYVIPSVSVTCEVIGEITEPTSGPGVVSIR